MKLTLAILASLTIVLAAPPPTGSKTGSCTFSANEQLNLQHGHDVNTGQINIGGKITKGAPKIFGSGCSPAWAVGGDPHDNTPTKTSVGAAKGVAVPAV